LVRVAINTPPCPDAMPSMARKTKATALMMFRLFFLIEKLNSR
jgi:hypothetical protein